MGRWWRRKEAHPGNPGNPGSTGQPPPPLLRVRCCLESRTGHPPPSAARVALDIQFNWTRLPTFLPFLALHAAPAHFLIANFTTGCLTRTPPHHRHSYAGRTAIAKLPSCPQHRSTDAVCTDVEPTRIRRRGRLTRPAYHYFCRPLPSASSQVQRRAGETSLRSHSLLFSLSRSLPHPRLVFLCFGKPSRGPWHRPKRNPSSKKLLSFCPIHCLDLSLLTQWFPFDLPPLLTRGQIA